MTKQPLLHPIAEQYLEDLGRLTAALPRSQRFELLEDVRAHLEAGLALGSSEVDVRNLLEALGSPEDVMAAADVTPTRSISTNRPLVLGLLAALTLLPSSVSPGLAVVPGTLGLAACWTGIRAIRGYLRASRRSWPAVLGTALGAFAFLAPILWWGMLFAAGSRLSSSGPIVVTASDAPTSALPSCSTPRYTITRGLNPAVAKAVTQFYTAEGLAPITFDPATQTELIVSMNAAGVHRCTNSNGEEGGWVGTLPASATEGVQVSVNLAPRPDATHSTWTVVTVAYIPGQGWTVVNEALSP